MKVFYHIDDVKGIGKTGVALGNFDGVHIGHQKLIRSTVRSCKENNLSSIIFTFQNHPRNITDESNSVKIIATWKEKIELIQSFGVDYMVAVEFDKKFREMSPEDFVTKILIKKLNMQEANCGFHYKFGHKARGNTDILSKMARSYRFKLFVLNPVKIDNNLVSSTIIRELISAGKMEECSKFLGRYYSLEGTVIWGKQLGKKMGFPTANILVNESRVIPPNGVYITKCFVNNNVYDSITNIGYKPTIGSEKRLIETYIIGFDKDIYGEEIKVEFYKNIRGEVKFNSIDELKNQIQKDLITANNYHKSK